jgi:rod shape-determining protein MreC
VPSPRRFGRSRFTLVLLVLASLTILTLDYRDSGPVQGLRGVFGTVFSPFEGIGNAVASPFENGWKGIFEYDDLEDENAELRERIEELENQEIETAALEEEIAALSRTQNLDYPLPQDLERVTARVTSGPLTSFDSTFEIDKGSGDGLSTGMPVVAGGGLVGRIERVEGGSARIRVITDPAYVPFGVKLVEGGDVGKAEPAADGMLEISSGIDDETPVERGDGVVTSGLDGSAYPPLIPVGTVASRRLSEDRTEQIVTVEPSADLDGLSFVVILLCDEDCS